MARVMASQFDAFYRNSSSRLLAQEYLSTGDLAASQDAVAEAFARAWERWSQVSRADSPEAWVRTVAIRVAISNWRKLRNRLTAHSREARQRSAVGDDDVPAVAPEHVVLLQALRTLPIRHRQAVVLHYFSDMRVADITREMQVAEGTVKAWLSRGRAGLRTHLEDPADRSPPTSRSDPGGHR